VEEEPPARVIGNVGWALCSVKVERKVVKTDNQFRELENNDDEAGEDDGGYGEDKEFVQEIMFEQKRENSYEYKPEINVAKKKVRFEKMPKKNRKRQKSIHEIWRLT